MAAPDGVPRLAVDAVVDLLDRSPDALFRYRLADPRGFEFVSAGITQIVGYSPQDHYDDPDLATRIVHPDDLDLVARSLEGGLDRASLTMRWMHRDGGVVWTEQRLRLVRADGAPVAIEGAVRRVDDPARSIASGDLELDLIATRVTIGGRSIDLTPSEHRILAMLALRDGTVSRRDLVRQLWDSEFTANERVLDVHVSNLRRKLDDGSPTRIETVKGLGYRLRR